MAQRLTRTALIAAFSLSVIAGSLTAYSQPSSQPFSLAPTEQQDAKTHKNKYDRIEIGAFEIEKGVEFPENYLTTLMGELAAQLQETRKFKQVSREGEGEAKSEAPAIRLTGKITEFKPGNRALRYIVGPGVGKTKIKATVKFSDRATGETLYEGTVDGKVIIGFFGGDSIGATRGLAKEVAKVTRKNFF